MLQHKIRFLFCIFSFILSLSLCGMESGYPYQNNNHNSSNSSPNFNPVLVSAPKSTKYYPSPLETIPEGTDIEVLLVGQTGSGKTTFLNMAANYFLFGSFGVNIDEQKVRVIIPTKYLQSTEKGFNHSEHDLSDQGKSQTKKPKKYTLGFGNRHITFIDTPGMGDTEGLDRDDKNLSNILKKASSRGKLSGVILFFNGAEVRDNATKKYSFEKLKSSLPDVAVQNMIVVLTNTHKDHCSFNVEQITKLGVTKERIFYIDNTVLASDPESWKDKDYALRLSLDWSNSMQSLGNICAALSTNSTAVGQEFKRMYELRNRVMQEFHQVRLKFAEIQETQNAIESYQAKFNAENALAVDFKDFAKRATIETREFSQDPNRHYSTVCSVHNTACHDECSLKETITVGDQIFTGCWAFDNTDGKTCKICSTAESCSFVNHYHARGQFINVKKTLQDRLEEYKKIYDEAYNNAQSTQAEISSTKAALEQIAATIDEFANEVQEILEELKGICKGYNFVAELNSTILMLKQEAKCYTSHQAINSANKFIAALEEMSQRLTDQGLAQGSSDSKAFTGFGHQLKVEEIEEVKSVFSSVKNTLRKVKYVKK